MTDNETRDMLIEYMAKGFLENIIAMFRQDDSLYRFLPDMIGDENIRVRLGATALAEELVKDHRKELKAAEEGIIGLLVHENPTIRGDAVYVLGLIGDLSAEGQLRALLEDDNSAVVDAAKDALAEIEARDPGN